MFLTLYYTIQNIQIAFFSQKLKLTTNGTYFILIFFQLKKNKILI